MMRPLDGIFVLDLTRALAGPYATVSLGDYGAEVVKVESLPDGDMARQQGVDFVGQDSAQFLMWNRNKKSIALNLRSPESREIMERLIAKADVLIHNFRPGVPEKMGLGYERVARLNPALIYCAISAYGIEPALASYPGSDPAVQAMSGVMSVTGERGRGPVLVGVPVADFTGAMLAVQGVLLALVARSKTGRGQRVDVSLLYGMLSALTTRLATYWNTGETPERMGSEHTIYLPYQVFETKDGYCVAGCFSDRDWPKFCDALAAPELLGDGRFATNIVRKQNRQELTDLLCAAFLTRTTGQWEERFRSRDVLFSPVFSIPEILDHPQVREAGLLQTVEHPKHGPIPTLGPVIKLSDTPGRVSSAAPSLGQHTAAVLADLGYGEDEIRQLIQVGAAALEQD